MASKSRSWALTANRGPSCSTISSWGGRQVVCPGQPSAFHSPREFRGGGRNERSRGVESQPRSHLFRAQQQQHPSPTRPTTCNVRRWSSLPSPSKVSLTCAWPPARSADVPRSSSVRSSDHGNKDDSRHRSDRDRSDRDRHSRDSDRRRRRDSPEPDSSSRREHRERSPDRDAHRDSKRRRSRSREREPRRDDRERERGGDYDRRPSYRDHNEYDRDDMASSSRNTDSSLAARRPRHRGSPSYDPYGRGNDRDREPPRRSPSPQCVCAFRVGPRSSTDQSRQAE